MSGAAVFSYVSLYEGFGLPILDAMAPASRWSRRRSRRCRKSRVVRPSSSTRSISRPSRGDSTGDPRFATGWSRPGLARAAARCWDDVAAETWDVYRWAGPPFGVDGCVGPPSSALRIHQVVGCQVPLTRRSPSSRTPDRAFGRWQARRYVGARVPRHDLRVRPRPRGCGGSRDPSSGGSGRGTRCRIGRSVKRRRSHRVSRWGMTGWQARSTRTSPRTGRRTARPAGGMTWKLSNALRVA